MYGREWPTAKQVLYILAFLQIILNAIITFRTINTAILSEKIEPPFLANDYPLELPINFDIVAMTLLRNTSRFEINLDDPISRKEWKTLSTHPFVVHLGENRRSFNVALFHQIHCLHIMEETFLRGEYHSLNAHHIQHCQNYLRQSFLCMADDSLEMGDFLEHREDINVGVKLCRDWNAVADAVEKNLHDWHLWNETQA